MEPRWTDAAPWCGVGYHNNLLRRYGFHKSCHVTKREYGGVTRRPTERHARERAFCRSRAIPSRIPACCKSKNESVLFRSVAIRRVLFAKKEGGTTEKEHPNLHQVFALVCQKPRCNRKTEDKSMRCMCVSVTDCLCCHENRKPTSDKENAKNEQTSQVATPCQSSSRDPSTITNSLYLPLPWTENTNIEENATTIHAPPRRHNAMHSSRLATADTHSVIVFCFLRCSNSSKSFDTRTTHDWGRNNSLLPEISFFV